ncbi:hypothetical protein L917_21744 [Phytophthora nicotianae]|uniref:Uncharacterized protein n=1 Tax=Phytophthora nicotianae TaxID=4792 RepID=W2JWK0_PHYNI|nr:hypothetical protein L917_21744 [Phytophthora nicotianae]
MNTQDVDATTPVQRGSTRKWWKFESNRWQLFYNQIKVHFLVSMTDIIRKKKQCQGYGGITLLFQDIGAFVEQSRNDCMAFESPRTIQRRP